MVRKSVIGDGVRVISERIEHLQSVSFGIWVDVGSRDEVEAQNGVAHFIEHMIFKGTRNRSSLQIAKELDAIGGLSNAFTGKENTCFHTRVLGRDFARAADILVDIFRNSLFEPADVERERQVIFQEISMVEDNPEDNIHVLLQRLFWQNHPIGMSVLGTGESVSAIGKAELLEHLDRFYVPRSILVTAAGNVEHDALVSCFRPLSKGVKEAGRAVPPRTVPQVTPSVSCRCKELEQVHVCLGAGAPSSVSEERFASALFNTILGGNMSSRLFQEVRENRGLAYSVYSFVSAYLDAGLLGVYVATDPGRVNEALATILEEIRKMAAGRMTESDLAEAKEHLVGGIYLGAESPDSRMMRLAKNELLFGRHIDHQEVVSALERVSLEEVTALAAEIARNGAMSLVTLGPLEERDLDRSCLAFPGPTM